MSDDNPGRTPEHTDKRSWLERLSQAFSGDPRSREELIEVLRDAQDDGLIAADTLKMMEGAIGVSEKTVAAVMVPRCREIASSQRTGLARNARGDIETIGMPW